MDIFLIPLIIIAIVLVIITSHGLTRVILRQKAEHHLRERLRQDKDYQYIIRKIAFPYECISQIHLTTEKIIQLQSILEQKLAALNERERKYIIYIYDMFLALYMHK